MVQPGFGPVRLEIIRVVRVVRVIITLAVIIIIYNNNAQRAIRLKTKTIQQQQLGDQHILEATISFKIKNHAALRLS